MGNMHLVTGLAGKKHVTSADQGSFNAAIFGTGNYVLNRGNKFAASIITNNQIRVQDGDLILQGRHARLNEKTYVDLTIENGTVGMYRNDLIVARYTKDAASGVEDINLVVIKGTAATSSPADPEYTEADIINDHVLIADMPLFRVPLDGLNVQELVPLYTEASLVSDGSVTAAKIANGAVSQTYTATIPVSAWTQYANYATCTAEVSGLLGTDAPIVDINLSGTSGATLMSLVEAWGNIIRAGVEFSTGKLYLYSTEIPTVDLPVKILCIRK